jgi:hypothetical protein
MLNWLLAHQSFLAAIAVFNGASIVALIIGISFTPSVKE